MNGSISVSFLPEKMSFDEFDRGGGATSSAGSGFSGGFFRDFFDFFLRLVSRAARFSSGAGMAGAGSVAAGALLPICSVKPQCRQNLEESASSSAPQDVQSMNYLPLNIECKRIMRNIEQEREYACARTTFPHAVTEFANRFHAQLHTGYRPGRPQPGA